MSRMHDPPHPGEIIKELCLEPLGLSVTDAAKGLGVTRRRCRNCSTAMPACRRKWRYGWNRHSAAPLKRGSRCSSNMICGRRNSARAT
jgi:hypothetical protein